MSTFVTLETVTGKRNSAKMTVRLAEEITGGLGNPSKMPGKAYGFSAEHCITGRKLWDIEGSVCFHCYAKKGNYIYPSVKMAHANRFATWQDPRWVEAMIFLVNRYCDVPFFRWHDSGDLQSLEHLIAIVAVCRALPGIKFWMPTREYKIVLTYLRLGHKIPSNLVIRLSAHRVDGPAPIGYGLPTSSVHSEKSRKPAGMICEARKRNNACGDCRACWDPTIDNVSYPQH